MKQRHDGHDTIHGREAEIIGRDGHHGVEQVGAVRIEHALGIACCARGVAHAGGGILVESGPAEIAIGLVDVVLVGDGVFQRCLRHVGRICQDYKAFDCGQAGRQFLDKGHKGEIEEKNAVRGMVDDEDDLILEEARIDGMVDGTDTGDAVPAFKMPPSVPGKGCDAVAEADAVTLQPLREFQGSEANRGVIGAVDRAFDGAGDDFALRVLRGGIIDDTMNQQWPILHQSKHGFIPPNAV